MEALSLFMINLSHWALPFLAAWLLWRCVRSMLSQRYRPEIWAYIEGSHGEVQPIYHWECIIGRGRSSDVVIDSPAVSRAHASLIRSGSGKWKLYDLDSKGGSFVGEAMDLGKGVSVHDGDIIRVGDVSMVFHDLTEAQLAAVESQRNAPGRVSPAVSLLILTVFQALLALQFSFSGDPEYMREILLGFAAICVVGWLYYLIMRAFDRIGFELETLALFLSTLGIAVVASSAPGDMLKQLILLLAAIAFYLILGFWLRDIRRAKLMRWPVAALALGLLAVNIIAGETSYGATNWLSFGGFTLQPSEFVKVAYIYTGTATLDRLFRGRNLFLFIAFSAICVGALALMGDFGTALIFFCTFLVISFLRSGSFATIFLALAGAALAVMLVLTVKPYVAQRFSTWGHIWEDPFGAGWQQTQGLSAAAEGGLFGVGAGKGWCKDLFAADTDMIFCLLSEELGLIMTLIAMLALVSIAFFAVKSAGNGRSSFYVIAACAASCMMLVQLALNCFGCVDILPFTGVTFPFVSKGGSSLISCWGLLAFIKASDTRMNASFSVKRSYSRRFAPVVAQYEAMGQEAAPEENTPPAPAQDSYAGEYEDFSDSYDLLFGEEEGE